MKVKVDLVEYFSERLEKIQKGLSDDDTLSDYLSIHPILSKIDRQELNTLIVGNWLIQNDAFSPEPYKVIETKDYNVLNEKQKDKIREGIKDIKGATIEEEKDTMEDFFDFET